MATRTGVAPDVIRGLARDFARTRQAACYVGETLRAEPMMLTLEVQAALDRMDRQALGYARAPEPPLTAAHTSPCF